MSIDNLKLKQLDETKILETNKLLYPKNINIIVAYDKKRGIGIKNNIPWPKLILDLKRFKKITMNNIIIMGRKTWNSINNKPLKKRINIIITSTPKSIDILKYKNCYVYKSLDSCLRNLNPTKKKIFIIGGEQIYKQTINITNMLYVTYIHQIFKCDTYFPPIFNNFFIFASSDEKIDKNIKFTFITYKKIKNIKFYPIKIHNFYSTNLNYGENAYLDLLEHTLYNGDLNKDRTKIGTINTFGNIMRFNLLTGFPLITTKKVYWKGIVEELLWFLRGETDSKILNTRGVKIWDGNSSKNFLDNLGFKYREVGDCGPIYGFNFRNFGAKYIDCHTDYTGRGFDQIKYVIDMIKNKPDSRRILINLWNPGQLNTVVLPSCFTERTLIITNNGYKYIKDVEDNDLLLTHKGNFKYINKKYKTNFSGNLYKIKLQYQTIPIETTHNHPFYVRKVIYKNNPKFIECGEPEWIEAKNLNENYYCGIQINQKSDIPEFKFIKNINQFSKKEIIKKLDNLDEWFLLGYFLCNRWNRNYESFNLIFHKKDEEELIQKFKHFCTMIKIKNKVINYVIYDCYNYVLVKILKQFGRKVYNKYIPEWVQNAPIKYIEKFIKGYIRADECRVKQNDNIFVNITTTSKNIAYGMQRLYLKLGKFCKVGYQKRPNKCIIEGRMVNQQNIFSIILIENKKRQIRSFIKNNYAWIPIIKIEKFNQKNIFVYNFDVSDDHTYVVNNISVHNCHILYQFRVINKKFLSCMLTQRSGDMCLGVPFNIASASLLLHIIAKLTDKIPFELVHSIGDTHIYKNHIEGAKVQIKRKPFALPILEINNDIKKKKIKDLTIKDFKLIGYNYHPKIKFKMAC